MSDQKQYVLRDIVALDKAGGHYSRHVSAMTTEDLHSKHAIAAELAWRDHQIAELVEAMKSKRFASAFAEGIADAFKRDLEAAKAKVKELETALQKIANLEPVRGCNSAETAEALYGRLAQCNEIAREAL